MLNKKLINHLAVLWAVLGLTLIFVPAIFRVMPYASEAISSGLTAIQWVVMIIWCLFMFFSEGYRGFQKQFSPRVAARVLYLFDNPKTIDLLFAPLFCMGYFHATKKRLIVTWSVTIGISLIVATVKHVSQPWRGIIDLGVVLGLIYGLIATYYFLFLAIKTRKSDVDPEVG